MVIATSLGVAVRAADRTWNREPGTGTGSASRAGYCVTFTRGCLVVFGLLLLVCVPGAAFADEYFTLIVSGASGGAEYTERHERWRSTLIGAWRERTNFRDDHVILLAETPGPGVGRASREGVRQAVSDLRARMGDDSVLLVVLFGHGTFDGIDAKFNLVGPDLEAAEWRALLAPLPGYVIFVNTTAASFAFLDRMAGDRRVTITATESPVQRYDTMFPEFFVAAFSTPSSDRDKSGRVSVWEAFAHASAEVSRWYRQQGRLATERPMLDDSGDGAGTEADSGGADGALSARLYVGAGVDAPTAAGDPELEPLVARRAALEAQVATWQGAKATMTPERYRAQLERLFIEMAWLSREIRRWTDPDN